MIHMPLPYQLSSSNRNLPRRVDSLKPAKSANFAEVEDELRDVRRVYSQGQEEDLRYALSRTINRIEELTSILKEAYKTQTDLQTELTLAKSNLQMALANNEMLEDALKRDTGHSKDIGWRRISAREQSLKAEAEAEADRRRSTDSLTSTEFSSSPTLSQSSPAPEPPSAAPRSATMPSPVPSSENKFFRFRFGNGVSSSHPSSPRLSTQSPTTNGSHLTSASLPSLVPPNREKEIEDLQHQLETEQKAHKAASEAKTALEAELESLSQALFEEANKMVATERRKLAETEEALREAREQGEALKNVLRLFERDSTAGRARTSVSEGQQTQEQQDQAEYSPAAIRSRHRASSSAIGIKSPSSGIPSPRSHPSSPVHTPNDLPSSASTVTANSAPAPASTSAGRSVAQHGTNAAAVALSATSTEPSVTASVVPDISTSAETSTSASTAGPRLSALSTSAALHTSPTPSPSPSPSPSPIPSPLSAPGQFLFTPARPVNYYDGEESPWADATSAASPRVVT